MSLDSRRPLLAQTVERVRIDAQAPTTPFPHFWEQTFGSGRAILSLRQSYRDDLRTVKQATDFQSVRFHGIFNDEVGLYDPDRRTINFAQTAGQAGAVNDASVYNFSYVDQIYDGLLANGVRPYVEMSFMPKKLASDPGGDPSLLVPPQRLAAGGLCEVGRDDPRLRARTSSRATASTRSPPGSSRCGTSPTSTSGAAIRSRRLTLSSTTTPRAR